MKKASEPKVIELDNLICIQKEMLDESRRLRYLTAWLIVLTLLLLGISAVTAAYTL
jgi:hypothetical protein